MADTPSYNDQYATCASTYATLTLYSDVCEPQTISQSLQAAPSKALRLGTASGTGSVPVKRHTWMLTSEGTVDSRDARRHIDWVLDRVSLPDLARLLETTCDGRLWCFWLSQSGHGGPTLSPAQCRRAAKVGLDIVFDVYFPR